MSKKNQKKLVAKKSAKAKSVQKRPTMNGGTRTNQRVAQFRLSPCSQLYARALTDPFSNFPGQVCIPDLYDSPSLKTRTLARGTFAVGAANFGFITVNTQAMVANDTNPIIMSTATYPDVFVPSIFGGVGMFNINNHQAPYSSGQLSGGAITGIIARIVALGLRIRYIGTELNRGGTLLPYRSPQNRPYDGFSYDFAAQFAETHPRPVDRQWHGVNYLPVRSVDYEYKNNPAVNQAPATDGSAITIFVKGPGAGVPCPFEYEIVAFIEYAGDLPTVTPSHSDVPGMSAIRNFLEGGLDGDPSTKLYQEVLTKISKLGPAEISGYVSSAAQVLNWVSA